MRVEMPGFGDSPLGSVATVAGWAWFLLAGARAGQRLAGFFLLASIGARRHRAFALPRAYAVLGSLLGFPLTRPFLVPAGRSSYRRVGLTPPATWRELHRPPRAAGLTGAEDARNRHSSRRDPGAMIERCA